MPPSLPIEILGQIVDSLFAEENRNESEPSSSTATDLLFTSRVLRICALRNLCRAVVVDCDDDKPNDKLREILIPGTVNPRLGSIAPFIRTLQINLRNCTSSPTRLAEVSALMNFILEQCPLQTLILEGTYCDDSRPESESEYLTDWAELPPVIRGPIEALLGMPTLRSLKVYAMSGFSKDLFGETPHVKSLEINFSQVPPAPALKKLRHIVAHELGTPDQIYGLWNVCRLAHQYLEEVEIHDAFWCPYIHLRNDPHTIPDSIHLHAFPKIRKFTFHSHNDYLGSYGYPPPCPPISFFRVESVVPEFQCLHLRVDMIRAARSVGEALSRVADPNWVILDSLLTGTNFPNLRLFYLVLDQDVGRSVLDTFEPNVDGTHCALAAKQALQRRIEDGLKSSFPHLIASTAIDFKLEAIVKWSHDYI